MLEQQQIQQLLENVEALELVSDSLFRFAVGTSPPSVDLSSTHAPSAQVQFAPAFFDHLLKPIFRLDASMVSNDHNYFVFEDLLHDVMRPLALHLVVYLQSYFDAAVCHVATMQHTD